MAVIALLTAFLMALALHLVNDKNLFKARTHGRMIFIVGIHGLSGSIQCRIDIAKGVIVYSDIESCASEMDIRIHFDNHIGIAVLCIFRRRNIHLIMAVILIRLQEGIHMLHIEDVLTDSRIAEAHPGDGTAITGITEMNAVIL